MNNIPFSAIDLGFIFKQMKHNFSMETFNDRLELQKKIYLLQMHGIDQGYTFRYYIRGPYCTKLATDGFELEKFYKEIEDFDEKIFHEKKVQDVFEKAVKFIKKLGNTDNYEIATSLHLLHKMGKPKHQVIKEVADKVDRFKELECEKIWDMLYNEGFVTDD